MSERDNKKKRRRYGVGWVEGGRGVNRENKKNQVKKVRK